VAAARSASIIAELRARLAAASEGEVTVAGARSDPGGAGPGAAAAGSAWRNAVLTPANAANPPAPPLQALLKKKLADSKVARTALMREQERLKAQLKAAQAARDPSESSELNVVDALRDLKPGMEKFPGEAIMELSEALAAATTAVSGEVSRRDTASKCCICLAEERDVVFMPCFHLVACWECSKRMCECPICRKDISQKRRVYN